MIYEQLPLPPNEAIGLAHSESLEGSCLNNYRLVHKIGAGTFGLIFLVEDVVTGQQFAAKMVLKKNVHSQPGKALDIEQNKKNIHQLLNSYFAHRNGKVHALEMPLDMIRDNAVDCPLLREIALQLRVHDHPLIATIQAVLNIDKIAIVIIMDYFPQGDLFHNIIDLQVFQNPEKSELDRQYLMKNVFLQLIEAIKYCAAHNVFHCDLKPENIMINYNSNYVRKNHNKSSIVDYNEIQVCLIDFGLAMDSDLVCCNVRRGSSFYMAPERITNYTTSSLLQTMCDLSNYTSTPEDKLCTSPSYEDKCSSKYFPTLAGDIWLLGVLLVNITCARNPWPIAQLDGTHSSNGNNHVFHSYITENKSVLREILPISRGFNKLLNKIFVIDPNSRIDLSSLEVEIRKCEFFHDYVIKDKSEKYFTSDRLLSFQGRNQEQHNNNDGEVLNTPVSLYDYYDD